MKKEKLQLRKNLKKLHGTFCFQNKNNANVKQKIFYDNFSTTPQKKVSYENFPHPRKKINVRLILEINDEPKLEKRLKNKTKKISKFSK